MTAHDERLFARRRARIAGSPPFLRGGFRPFFFFGSAWAAIALVLWLMAAFGGLNLPSAFQPLVWHRHEMLFGFVGAIIAGFLLTAIPNWTARPPIAGWPLAALVGLWAAGRMAVLVSGWIGPAPAAVVDVAFYIVLTGVAAREVLASRNRNLPIAGLVLLLGVANAADHAGAAGLLYDADFGIRAALSVVAMMISVVGGRIIPAFTRNWMVKQGISDRLPAQPTRFDLSVLAVTAGSLLAWAALPAWAPSGWMLAVAGCAQALRLSRWGGLRSARDPLVVILHVGYFWLAVGLLLLGASIIVTWIPRSAAIHALTAGAMGTMILAVMTRAILGHTGRDLVATLPTTLFFGLITVGAAVRVATPFGILEYSLGIEIAAIAWAGAFVLFLFAFGPLMFRFRVDEA
ncbi:NnrS family protein [Phenylobacterium sp.]|uniref:NnrS family protein n=1 Tax=Phenylobacterium sp. TaxID=1871053 RepID=UPI003565154E